MSHAEDVIVLRCYALPRMHQGELGFQAQCIDLDLTVWRPTLDDARRQLEIQISGYLRTIRSEEEFEQLIPRRSPFFPDRLRYHLVALLYELPALWRRISASLFEQRIRRDQVLQGAGA